PPERAHDDSAVADPRITAAAAQAPAPTDDSDNGNGGARPHHEEAAP
ncbi:MAG: hypothetical protein JK586_04805, partial [Nocardiopsis sp. BM-2018]